MGTGFGGDLAEVITLVRNTYSIRRTWIVWSVNEEKSFRVIRWRSLARMRWYSRSELDLIEIERKRPNSFALSCPLPSTMLVGIDSAARMICNRNAALSLPRIFFATEMALSASEWLFSQTFNFLKSLTPKE